MSRLLCLCAISLAALGTTAGGACVQENAEVPSPRRTEAVQIDMPQSGTVTHERPVYLDQTLGYVSRQLPDPSDQISLGDTRSPASQVTARGHSGPDILQLSKADLGATLAQLSAVERRVLFQALEGTDICDDPPDVPAIVALCQTRIESRHAQFAALVEGPVSAEDRMLRGDLGDDVLTTVRQVIDRLARGSAWSGDFSIQAIASMALTPPTGFDETQPSPQGLSEEAQALVDALVSQLQRGAP